MNFSKTNIAFFSPGCYNLFKITVMELSEGAYPEMDSLDNAPFLYL
jgi:hypothetical protein